MTISSFIYADKTYEYTVQLLHTRKKTISIHVLPNASVEVKAPAHATMENIVEVINKRAHWIVHHVDNIQQHTKLLVLAYVSGETHFYMGRRYVLKVVLSDIDQVKLIRGQYVVLCKKVSKEHVKNLLQHWYKTHAQQAFQKRLNIIIASITWLNNIPPLTVRRMKKQWGSCSSTGRVSLNSHLIKAPLHCIDYVITHELCHLKEHNHSKGFYALMDSCFPDWRTVKSKLDGIAELLLNE